MKKCHQSSITISHYIRYCHHMWYHTGTSQVAHKQLKCRLHDRNKLYDQQWNSAGTAAAGSFKSLFIGEWKPTGTSEADTSGLPSSERKRGSLGTCCHILPRNCSCFCSGSQDSWLDEEVFVWLTPRRLSTVKYSFSLGWSLCCSLPHPTSILCFSKHWNDNQNKAFRLWDTNYLPFTW